MLLPIPNYLFNSFSLLLLLLLLMKEHLVTGFQRDRSRRVACCLCEQEDNFLGIISHVSVSIADAGDEGFSPVRH